MSKNPRSMSRVSEQWPGLKLRLVRGWKPWSCVRHDGQEFCGNTAWNINGWNPKMAWEDDFPFHLEDFRFYNYSSGVRRAVI